VIAAPRAAIAIALLVTVAMLRGRPICTASGSDAKLSRRALCWLNARAGAMLRR